MNARSRKPRVLIIGCGDVGMRVAQLLQPQCRVLALTSSPQRIGELRAADIVPLLGNLDEPATLGRLAGLADRVLHLAPPPLSGRTDPRTLALLRALALRSRPRSLVYASTTGVYGHCEGEWIDETRALGPLTDRAWRRVHAEGQLRWAARATGLRACILRVPGIYAADRAGGDPRDRVRRGQPLLNAADDGYTNHIHADDLARICVAALWRGAPQRVYHASDDGQLKTGDHYDLVADLSGLPRSPRISREEALQLFSAMQMSFLSESRRLRNQRMKRELRLGLRFPTVAAALGAANSS